MVFKISDRVDVFRDAKMDLINMASTTCIYLTVTCHILYENLNSYWLKYCVSFCISTPFRNTVKSFHHHHVHAKYIWCHVFASNSFMEHISGRECCYCSGFLNDLLREHKINRRNQLQILFSWDVSFPPPPPLSKKKKIKFKDCANWSIFKCQLSVYFALQHTNFTYFTLSPLSPFSLK